MLRLSFRFWFAFASLVVPLGCGRDELVLLADDDAAFVPRPTTSEAGKRRFVQLAAAGSVPGVSAQPSDRGRSFGTLHAFGPRVYVGYGDYTDNTGPIASVSYSILSESFDVGQLLPTEEILEYATHDGFLFAADLDPRGHEAQGSVFRLSSWARGWQAMPAVEGAVHTFSMATYDGRLFAGLGSVLGQPARLASTADHGSTWTIEHETSSPADGFTRYSHLGATASKLFVSGRIHVEPPEQFAYLYSSGTWRPVADLPANGFLIPLALDEELVVLQFSNDRGKGGEHLATFELADDKLVENDASLPSGVRVINWNLEQDPDGHDRLWLLCLDEASEYAVYSAQRLGDWTRIVELSELPEGDRLSAIAYLDNSLYLGSAGGAFYAVRDIFELL